MSENSKIEWTDHTFNPWIGCTKVSPGCKHCYAEVLMTRKPRWADTWGPQGTRIRTSETYWKQPLSWNRKAEKEGRRYKVFCGSLCDVFEIKDDQPELYVWRGNLFGLIDQTPHLDWLLLTKRPENISHFYDDCHNVWLGTSVENQEQADKRIPELLKVPAVVRFLSVEPMLGPVDLWRFGDPEMGFAPKYDHRGTYDFYRALGWPPGSTEIEAGINWVIVGGESGPNARPMHPDWPRTIRDQCASAGVPFFMKQMTSKGPIPDDLFVREFPEIAEVTL